ncbi:M20/M25/M40 family metallo-hydrolase [Pedobacter sp.]|uniref:M20/M25/M40 family metallo-hydrolase n=1 Tax=Pedobacter sp. TaxID=1411316 RepID=UPI003BA9F37D
MNNNFSINVTMEPDLNRLYQESLELLSALVNTPSITGEEQQAADLIEQFLKDRGVETFRKHNNIWCFNRYQNNSKPCILLISHHDTSAPLNKSTEPGNVKIEEDVIYGLGSNDAGGSLVALIATFLYFYESVDLPFNLCLAATAEEENSGINGIRSILDVLQQADFAIIGEPTAMQMAVAEKGSMVIDCKVKGVSGHAAREEGDNAIYRALKDIDWFRNYQFPIMDNHPQPVKMTVTEIASGIQHNVIPATCNFTVDIRFDHNYTPKEIINTIINHTSCEFDLRNAVSKPCAIDLLHPIVTAGCSIGLETYLSTTSSDQCWLEIPAVKIGPGNPGCSHMENEFIAIEQIEEGINTYIRLLRNLNLIN